MQYETTETAVGQEKPKGFWDCFLEGMRPPAVPEPTVWDRIADFFDRDWVQTASATALFAAAFALVAIGIAVLRLTAGAA